MLLERYANDSQKLLDGIEMPLGEAFFTLTYFNSDKAQVFYNTKLAIYQKTMDMVTAMDKAIKELLIEIVVLGWRNFKERNDNGEWHEIPYSKENCKRVLYEYSGLSVDLMGLAGNITLFKKEDVAKSKKKSKRPLRSGIK